MRAQLVYPRLSVCVYVCSCVSHSMLPKCFPFIILMLFVPNSGEFLGAFSCTFSSLEFKSNQV